VNLAEPEHPVLEQPYDMLERLHKVLARAGVAALRPAEDMIMAGRVTVNGRVVRELGARVDPEADVIAVDGQLVELRQPSDPHRYVLVHKPVGVISTAHDTHDRPTVVGLVPSDQRLFSVGRLDADSEGLILLTDDGDLAYRLTHPRFQVEKEYRVLLDRTPSIEDLRTWREGVELEGEMTMPAWV
jgi:23S rRNA pseudouridine2605 synthase